MSIFPIDTRVEVIGNNRVAGLRGKVIGHIVDNDIFLYAVRLEKGFWSPDHQFFVSVFAAYPYNVRLTK